MFNFIPQEVLIALVTVGWILTVLLLLYMAIKYYSRYIILQNKMELYKDLYTRVSDLSEVQRKAIVLMSDKISQMETTLERKDHVINDIKTGK